MMNDICRAAASLLASGGWSSSLGKTVLAAIVTSRNRATREMVGKKPKPNPESPYD
jgi:hypothetical protein